MLVRPSRVFVPQESPGLITDCTNSRRTENIALFITGSQIIHAGGTVYENGDFDSNTIPPTTGGNSAGDGQDVVSQSQGNPEVVENIVAERSLPKRRVDFRDGNLRLSSRALWFEA